jgi:hypothetical protein
MSNDKKRDNDATESLTRQPSQKPTNVDVKRDRSIEFGEGRRQLNEVLNTLPAPGPIKKK